MSPFEGTIVIASIPQSPPGVRNSDENIVTFNNLFGADLTFKMHTLPHVSIKKLENSVITATVVSFVFVAQL